MAEVDGSEEGYNHTHRALLQAFTGRATLTLAEAQPVLAAIQTVAVADGPVVRAGDITEAELNAHVAAINRQISPLDYEIRTAYTQTSPRTRVWAFVNTTSDALTQLATAHSADEIAFVKRVLDDMFDKYNTPTRELMAITGMQATNLRLVRRGAGEGLNGASQSLSLREAEKLLATLVEEGWFEREGDYYTLGTRALIELRSWLIDTYNDPADDADASALPGSGDRIKQCKACGEIVTLGQRCSTRACPCRLHDHCTANFFRMTRDQRCPLCKADWSGTVFVGPRAAF